MITIRPVESLHHVEGGWFSANWHFSFDTYDDPENTWFGDLRVFNDDTLIPGAVWPMHPHRDIEGITYVAEGMFEHADSRGQRRRPAARVRPAGNAGLGHGALGGQPLADRADAVHPDVDHPARARSRAVGRAAAASTKGRAAAGGCRSWFRRRASAVRMRRRPPTRSRVHQDATVYATVLDPDGTATHRFRTGFIGYLFAVHGSAHVASAGRRRNADEPAARRRSSARRRSPVRAGDEGAELLLVETRAIDR